MKWITPSEQMPTRLESVLTWSKGDWAHGHWDGQWYYGCECFPGEAPEYWAIPDSPESEEPKHE